MEQEYKPQQLEVAPATISSNNVTLIWNKPKHYEQVTGYTIYQDGKKIGQTSTQETHYTVNQLAAASTYHYYIQSNVTEQVIDYDNNNSNEIEVVTKPAGVTIDITKGPYFLDGTGQHLATKELQRAINECPKNGTVLIPKGATILTGAIDLKSNFTLKIDGLLKASQDPQDYVVSEDKRDQYPGQVNADGLVLSRYEGWELYCYRSLITSGYITPDNRRQIVCENVRICGTGTIYGGGNELGHAMKVIYADPEKYPKYVSDGIPGRRTRGRLISFIQCKNVDLTGIHIKNPSCWTIHLLYCNTVTTHEITIASQGIDNGDGWDPDSSQNLMIFATKFDTGDDCIAIKSGKNPEGNIINIPTKNIRIFDNNLIGGHGMAIGSEQSGGVENIYLRDIKIQNTKNGLVLKAHNYRGGYIKNIHLVDCTLDKFRVMNVHYNADGNPAPILPVIDDIKIENSKITNFDTPVQIIGFSNKKSTSYIQNIEMKNIEIVQQNNQTPKFYLKKCESIFLNNVHTSNGKLPMLEIDPNTVSRIWINNKPL